MKTTLLLQNINLAVMEQTADSIFKQMATAIIFIIVVLIFICFLRHLYKLSKIIKKQPIKEEIKLYKNEDYTIRVDERNIIIDTSPYCEILIGVNVTDESLKNDGFKRHLLT